VSSRAEAVGADARHGIIIAINRVFVSLHFMSNEQDGLCLFGLSQEGRVEMRGLLELELCALGVKQKFAKLALRKTDPKEVTQMVTDRKKDSDKTPVKQGPDRVSSEPNKINASTPHDFNGKNLTPYGGLLPAITMLEKLDFQPLVEQTVTSKRIPRALDLYRFVLGIVLGLYIGFPRLNQLRFIARDPILTGILKVTKLPVQSTFWRFVNALHLNVARQILTIMQIMRERVGAAANVKLAVVTIDTDTTVHTLYGQQMGGRKSYNPKNKGKKSYQPRSSEGWCIQWESTPPEQKSEFCSLDSREGRKLNPGSLSTKPSLG